MIAVHDLVKTYAYHQKAPGLLGSVASLFRRQSLERRAVDGVSFSIQPGEVVGFLGPNGAGKTTTLKVLCGLLYPTAGEVTVLGHVPSRRDHAFLRRISLVMGQKNMLWWDVPAMETLLLHRDMYGLDEAVFRRTVADLSALLEVEDLLTVQVRKLSLGERMKMELLVALVHRPEVLFLDEPTIGLDVVSQERVRDFLRRLNHDHGTTILLTSHYMDDIEALCPRVLVVDHGRIGFDGALADLIQRVAPRKWVTAIYAQPIPEETRLLLPVAGGVSSEEGPTDPRRVRLGVAREEVPTVVGELLRLGAVVDLSVEEAPVEEIIRDLFSGRIVVER